MAGITFGEANNVANSIYGKSQAPIRAIITKRARELEGNSMLGRIFKMGTSNKYAEKYASMTSIGRFQPVGENGKHPWTDKREGPSKTIEHEVWKSRFSATREIIDDDMLNSFTNDAIGFTESWAETREAFGAALLGGALMQQKEVKFEGTKFDVTGADGLPVFHAAHPLAASKEKLSNAYAGEFNKENFGKLVHKMQMTRGENGEILRMNPDTIVVPNDYTIINKVFEVVGSDKDPDTAGSNAFNYLFGRWNVLVWSELTDYVDLTGETIPYILMDSKYNQRVGGGIWLDRVPLEVTSYIDRDTNANVWDGYARFGVGFFDWRGMYAGGIEGGTEL